MGWRGFGFVHQSRTIFCRAVPNLSITIRNFFIAVLDPAPAPLVVLLSAEASALGLWQVERRPRYDAREKLYGCPFVLKSGSYGRRGNQPVGRRVSATCLSLLYAPTR
jgi:hypothetical protein